MYICNIFTEKYLLCLTLPMHMLAILSFPGSTAGSTNGLGVTVSLTNTTRALASRSQSAKFAMLVHVLANPVDLRITADGVVMNIDQDNFEVFVGSVLSYPVRVQNTQSSEPATNTLLEMDKSKQYFNIHQTGKIST